ncbi:MAG: transposase [Planctomycetota bacterium]|jgi:transposase
MAREAGNVAKIARDLDIGEGSLRNWVKQAGIDEGQGQEGALTSEEREELRLLRRKNRQLEMERDFLKKAAVFFAKEEDRRTR